MNDVLGQAIEDFHKGRKPGRLWVNNKYGPKEEMPIDTYFRAPDEMPDLEWMALQACRGSVLDIGAGAGSHALALQAMGVRVTALDLSPKNAAVMRERGVEHVLEADFFSLAGDRYDTLLLMMNGIGLAGTIEGLKLFFARAALLLNPGGQLLFDSSDIAYLYEGKLPAGPDYYGEILYQYEYKKEKGDWFKWLFIDRDTLTRVALECGWVIELLNDDGYDQFLVRAHKV